MGTTPLSSNLYPPKRCNSIYVACDMCILKAAPELSILEAVLTVSPNKQYLGIFKPTTPVTQ